MGPFVARYFDSSRRGWNCNIRDALGTRALVEDLMDFVQHHDNKAPVSVSASVTNEAMDGCDLAIAPLYLQWEGHSVTIVGIELLKENYQEYDLLVLDPNKKWPPSSSKGAGDTREIARERMLNHMRLSSRKIRLKDRQLIVASTKVQCSQEREERKRDETSGVVTAAIQKVQEVHRAKNAVAHGYV